MALTQPLIDLILLLVVAEFFALWVYLARAGKANLVPALSSFLLSGALLLGALRFALAETVSSGLILGLLAASFPIHIATLVLVWRAMERAKR